MLFDFCSVAQSCNTQNTPLVMAPSIICIQTSQLQVWLSMKYADITSKYYTWPKLKPVRSIIWRPECGTFGPPRHSIVASVVGILLVLPGELNITQHTMCSHCIVWEEEIPPHKTCWAQEPRSGQQKVGGLSWWWVIKQPEATRGIAWGWGIS